ncbi:hypothetical protein J007_02397 [Cryptococcus neoformans]|nr:hypothetical protein C356_02392 [Cryptococcus neoformans var. grubii c45]OXB37805.1 hypothetical protein J007_02397 [Cryptococcus neoformans var. grubii]OXC62141.1 hypothetical protein C358_02447 [Cryptococcus neoformans var. grubii MW-RSA852]
MHDYWPSHHRRRLRAASTLTPLQRWRVAVKASTLKVFLTTDASKVGMGAWIGVGTTKENAQRVAYDSRSFNSAQTTTLCMSVNSWPSYILSTIGALFFMVFQCMLSPIILRSNGY